MVLKSVFSEFITDYIEEKSKNCSDAYIKKITAAMSSFDEYCAESTHMTSDLTEGLINRWLFQHSNANIFHKRTYRIAIRQFALFLIGMGKQAYILPVYCPKHPPMEIAFKSSLRESIVGLLESKRSRGYKYGELNECGILRRFDSFCVDVGFEGKELPRWLVEKWSERNSGEGAKSRSNRIVVIRQLAIYMISQGKTAYIAESMHFPHNPFPYVPDENEMTALLKGIDSNMVNRIWSSYSYPVLFRLLLSSGLRISEACQLKKDCVEFFNNDYCTINIVDSKGHKDRKIYLSGGIMCILKKYNEKMSFIIPNRKWFFPSDYRPQDGHMTMSTARKHFNLARDAIFSVDQDRKPTVHSLRHAYIIWTIRRWRQEGLDVEKMLPYLSKHLGHSTIQETYSYYNHYNPEFEHVRKDSKHFDSIIPEVQHEE